jgi:prepilin-type N-terminal cleavage/methylation domain-containing protein
MFRTIQKLGFTMIELLIVIAVLGILAVAVLAAINPIEQINRGRDTGSRSDAEQLLSAIDRYYAAQGIYPWMVESDDPEEMAWTEVSAIEDTEDVPILTKLSSGGTSEIKTAFVNRVSAAGYNDLMLYNRGTQGDSTYICFKPKSGSFAEEGKVRCGDDGDGIPEDADAIAATVCAEDDYWVCLP